MHFCCLDRDLILFFVGISTHVTLLLIIRHVYRWQILRFFSSILSLPTSGFRLRWALGAKMPVPSAFLLGTHLPASLSLHRFVDM